MAGTEVGATAGTSAAFRTARPLPDIPGLLLRHLRAPDDYPPMNAIANATRFATGLDFTTTDDQLREYYEHPRDFDAKRDVAIVEIDGRMVGYVRSGSHQEVSGPRVYEILPFLDPTVATDQLLPLMLTAMEDHVRELAATDPDGDKVLQTFGGDAAPDREQIVIDAGYEAVRFSYSMVRPHLDDLPDAPLPQGLEIREVVPEHLAAIWAADQEAFRDAWGFGQATESDYQRFLDDPVQSDTSLWRIAWDGDQVAGQVRSYINPVENERFGRLRGYTESISVRRPWRRRGLARALIAASFPLLRARGMSEAALGVDTENHSGALRVYEGCGFRPVSRNATYRKPLA
jgi:ribosomal protein S18 acetylase RimI-like enzyme